MMSDFYDEERLSEHSIADIEAERAKRQEELARMREVYPDSLAIPIYERRIDALTVEISQRGEAC